MKAKCLKDLFHAQDQGREKLTYIQEIDQENEVRERAFQLKDQSQDQDQDLKKEKATEVMKELKRIQEVLEGKLLEGHGQEVTRPNVEVFHQNPSIVPEEEPLIAPEEKDLILDHYPDLQLDQGDDIQSHQAARLTTDEDQPHHTQVDIGQGDTNHDPIEVTDIQGQDQEIEDSLESHTQGHHHQEKEIIVNLYLQRRNRSCQDFQ